ncbi:lipid II flippase Amj family protein [candidate division KSB1 bacterium]
MSYQIIIVVALTFIIHLIATLAYSVRIVGIRTRHIFVAFSLFNIMVLISRTANGFQAPLLAKSVENNIRAGIFSAAESDFRLILLSATIATFAGAALIPTFQRLLSKAVGQFSENRSLIMLVLKVFTRRGIRAVEDSVTIPKKAHIDRFRGLGEMPLRIITLNVVVVSFFTVSVLSSLYAGYLNPELRATSSTLAAIVNGIPTILMFILIDPYMAGLTDDVLAGKTGEAFFRRCIFFLVAGRFLGTILAQLLLVPAAYIIVYCAALL